MSTPLHQQVHQIISLALRIAECGGPSVIVEYYSLSNQLRVSARREWSEPPVIEECLELYQGSDSEFVQRRVHARLGEITSQLDQLLLSCAIPPRPAA